MLKYQKINNGFDYKGFVIKQNKKGEYYFKDRGKEHRFVNKSAAIAFANLLSTKYGRR